MPDFLTKLVSITITLLNLWLTTYSCVRLANNLASEKRNPDGSTNNFYKWLFYVIAALLGMLFLWYAFLLPTSYGDLFVGSNERNTFAVYVVVFFFAGSIAHSVSGAEFDPQADDWQRRLEKQVAEALANKDEALVRDLVVEALKRIVGEAYGRNFYSDLQSDFYDLDMSSKKYESSQLVKAFFEGWHRKDDHKFMNASIEVLDRSLPVLISKREDRRAVLRDLDNSVERQSRAAQSAVAEK